MPFERIIPRRITSAGKINKREGNPLSVRMAEWLFAALKTYNLDNFVFSVTRQVASWDWI